MPSGAAQGAHYPAGTRGDIQAVTLRARASDVTFGPGPAAADSDAAADVTANSKGGRGDSESGPVLMMPRSLRHGTQNSLFTPAIMIPLAASRDDQACSLSLSHRHGDGGNLNFTGNLKF